MQLLLTPAVRVEVFAQVADALLQQACFEGGERKWLETAGFVIAGIIAHAKASACCQSPGDVNLGGQNAKMECVVARDCDEHVIREYFVAQESEEAVFAGFNRGDVAG